MTAKNITILIAGIVLILVSFILGRNSKQCPKIDSVVYHDTIRVETPIVYPPQTSYPISVATKKQHPKAVVKHDTPNAPNEQQISNVDESVANIGFKQIDTLRFKNMWVSITDTGDCYGVISRNHAFGGYEESSVITRTNNYILPPPLFQLNAGVQTLFNANGFKLVDVAPVVSLDYKHKHMASFSYGIETKQVLISLQTKIK